MRQFSSLSFAGHLVLIGSLLWTQTASGSTQDNQSPSQDSQKDKKKETKDKKDKMAPGDVDTAIFSEAAVNSVLNDLRDGLEGHNQRRLLSAFDADKMDGYLEFEDQIQAFFNKYESFRVHFRILQTSTEGEKGIALVDAQLEAIPRSPTSVPIRRSEQLRLELERGRKGWKIVDFRPRNFFS
jgi:hypothetical protein